MLLDLEESQSSEELEHDDEQEEREACPPVAVEVDGTGSAGGGTTWATACGGDDG